MIVQKYSQDAGRYIVSADDASNSKVIIQTGCAVVGSLQWRYTSGGVEQRRSGAVVVLQDTTNGTNGAFSIANGGSFTATEDDEIHWIATECPGGAKAEPVIS